MRLILMTLTCACNKAGKVSSLLDAMLDMPVVRVNASARFNVHASEATAVLDSKPGSTPLNPCALLSAMLIQNPAYRTAVLSHATRRPQARNSKVYFSTRFRQAMWVLVDLIPPLAYSLCTAGLEYSEMRTIYGVNGMIVAAAS
ncbi:hypothetical protein OH77DRAFT_184356 [Trametes cingulata]|nr:hypothetical protein OH77DRAFT_184356 [Trametes cingulata]